MEEALVASGTPDWVSRGDSDLAFRAPPLRMGFLANVGDATGMPDLRGTMGFGMFDETGLAGADRGRPIPDETGLKRTLGDFRLEFVFGVWPGVGEAGTLTGRLGFALDLEPS